MSSRLCITRGRAGSRCLHPAKPAGNGVLAALFPPPIPPCRKHSPLPARSAAPPAGRPGAALASSRASCPAGRAAGRQSARPRAPHKPRGIPPRRRGWRLLSRAAARLQHRRCRRRRRAVQTDLVAAGARASAAAAAGPAAAPAGGGTRSQAWRARRGPASAARGGQRLSSQHHRWPRVWYAEGEAAAITISRRQAVSTHDGN